MVLIDTHVLLWIFSDSGRLTTSARNAISGNAVCVSIASLWEIAIKASLKREDKRLELKELPHNARSTLTGEFQPPAACKFLDLPPASLRNLQFAFD